MEAIMTMPQPNGAHWQERMTTVHGRASLPGWLQHLPASWLHQLIQVLPAKDRLSIFCSSRQLARLMIQSAPAVSLQLMQCQVGRALDARRSIITQLLSEGRSFHVYMSSWEMQPFPNMLAAHITSLEWLQQSAITGLVQWGLLCNLKKLHLANCVTAQTTAQLASAVWAGQLPQLRSLTLLPHNVVGTAELEPLTYALAFQLTHLKTCDASMLPPVWQLQALQSLQIHSCDISATVMQQLCEHPSLRAVELVGSGCSIRGEHTQRNCKWDTLTITDAPPRVLDALPVASIKEVVLLGAITMLDPVDCKALRMVLTNPCVRVSAKPMQLGRVAFNSFSFWSVCEEAVVILQRLQGTCTLDLYGHVQFPDIMDRMWQSLPQCVTAVSFYDVTGVNWLRLWLGLPSSVTVVQLLDCNIKLEELMILLRTAPRHITDVKLSHADYSVVEQFEAARLQGFAPPHVSVTVTQ